MIDLSSIEDCGMPRPPPRAYTDPGHRPRRNTGASAHSNDNNDGAGVGTNDAASFEQADDPELFGDTVPLALNSHLTELREAEARAARARAAQRASARPPRGQTVRRNLLIVCILLGFFFSLLDTTIVSTSLLATSEDLDDFRDSSWVVLSYLLTYMGFSVFFAKLSDIYGRRNILIFSWIIFVISSIACGCSYSMIQLIVCRAIQGIGGAGLYSLTTITLPEIGPAHRPDIIGKIIGITLSMSFVLGPVLGGFIPQVSNWRVIYWLNAPFAIIAITGIVFLYPIEYSRRHGTGRTLRRVDFVGSLLLLTSTVLLVIALQEGGSQVVSWNSLLVLVSLTTSAISFALFMGWEYMVSAGNYWEMEAVFPLRLVKNRVYLCCLLYVSSMPHRIHLVLTASDKFLIGYIYLCLVIAVPQRFQIVNGENVFKTGLHLLPMLGGTALGCIWAGPLNAKKNRTAPVLVVSCALMLVGVSLLATVVSVEYPSGPLYGFMAVFGVGFGLFMSAGTMLSTAQAQRDDHAVAQGAIAQLRLLGGVIGLTTFTIIFNAQVQSANVTTGLTPEQIGVLRHSPTALVQVWPGTKGLIRTTFSTTFHVMAVVLAGLAGLALLVSLGTLEKNPPPIHRNFDKEKMLSASRESSSSRNDIELNDAASGRSLRVDRTQQDGAAPAQQQQQPYEQPTPTLFSPSRSHLPIRAQGRPESWRIIWGA